MDLGPEQMAELLIRERDRERDLESLGFAVARWGTPDLRDHGAGLCQALVEARRPGEAARDQMPMAAKRRKIRSSPGLATRPDGLHGRAA